MRFVSLKYQGVSEQALSMCIWACMFPCQPLALSTDHGGCGLLQAAFFVCMCQLLHSQRK